jgi:hypothetical protein
LRRDWFAKLAIVVEIVVALAAVLCAEHDFCQHAYVP